MLAAHLQAHGYTAQAQRRTQQLAGSYARVADSEQLAQLLMILEVFPRFLRAAEREGLLRGLRQRIAKVLEKQWQTLENALNDPGHDRHRVRLLIKRVRYAAEAYPELNQLPPLVLARLKGHSRRWANGTMPGNGCCRPGNTPTCNPVWRNGRPPLSTAKNALTRRWSN